MQEKDRIALKGAILPDGYITPLVKTSYFAMASIVFVLSIALLNGIVCHCLHDLFTHPPIQADLFFSRKTLVGVRWGEWAKGHSILLHENVIQS